MGYLLRWYQIAALGTSRCLVVGADAVHASLAPRTSPQVYQRIGVGQACASGPDLVIGSVSAQAGAGTVVPQLAISNVSSTVYAGSATVTLYLSTDQVFGG